MSVIEKLFKGFRAPRAKALGCLDEVEVGTVKGWAFDPGDPAGQVSVEFLIDGKRVAQAAANEYRKDLEQAGLGNGFHGFQVSLPPEILDGRRHTLEARIVGSDAVLQNSPLTRVFQKVPALEGNPAPDSVLSAMSVVIATRNRAGAMERNVRAAIAAAGNLDVEFIVIDDGSSDDTQERLRAMAAEFPNLRWRSVPQGGAGQARNIGVTMAAHELVLFLGDDVQPGTSDLYRHHINAHRMLPAVRVCVVGRVGWPNSSAERVSFLMAHVQGAGQQQFGFYSLPPYSWLDWRFFHAANVSFKKSVLADWMSGGFKAEFKDSAFDSAEFAFRVNASVEGGFQILYNPAAAVTHYEQCTVRQFIGRQLAAGMDSRQFTRAHPAASVTLGTDRLDLLLASPAADKGLQEDLIKMIEGAKSWGVVVEGRYRLGSQNWHGDLLNAIFELSFLQGYIMAGDGGNCGAAYQYALERFQERMSTAASFEVFGRMPSFTLT